MTSEQIQQDINRMQGSAAQLEGQIDTMSRRIAELREDRSGLERFGGQVNSDRAQFEGVLSRKRSSAIRASQVANARVATGISNMLGNRYGRSFESGVGGCFDGVRREIRNAIARIDDEIAQLNGRIAAAEGDLARTRQAIAQSQQNYERALAAEREA